MSDHKNRTVLIVDDEGEMRNLLASILRSCGYAAIEHAADGQQAVRALNQDKSIGIVFLDINMPGLNGLEVLAQARVSRPDCFCVVVSGDSALENVLTALEKGARGFVVKPYNIKKITDILAKYAREATP